MLEINQDFADGVLHSRNPETNKNDYGRILCVCGSAGYTGAAYFSAQGAVRMGSGVVTLAVPQGRCLAFHHSAASYSSTISLGRWN